MQQVTIDQQHPMTAPTQPDFYVYKLTTDNGGAPCVHQHQLSLAICKPRIRKSAGIGALIFGFGGKDYEERLLYIAQVTTKCAGDTYYTSTEYSQRPDCIYERDKQTGHAKLKSNARYHSDGNHVDTDVGPDFEHAFVLLSTNFRYLGSAGTDDYKNKYPAIYRLIQGLKQGHRRHLSDGLRKELLLLKAEVWEQHSSTKPATPSDKDTTKPCNSDEPCRIC
jgi:hypothetical protein